MQSALGFGREFRWNKDSADSLLGGSSSELPIFQPA
jgi:hypothetical protein